MRRTWLAAIATLALPPTGAISATQAFDLSRDGDAVVRCFATFLSVSRVVTGSDPLLPQRGAEDLPAYQGHMRLKPFANQAMANDKDGFYRRAVDIGLALEDEIRAAPDMKVKEALLDRMLADGRVCHVRMDAWGAAPFTDPLPKP
jgi:hypothetical protein